MTSCLRGTTIGVTAAQMALITASPRSLNSGMFETLEPYRKNAKLERIVGGTSAKSSSTSKPDRLFHSSLQYSVRRVWKVFGTFLSCIHSLRERSFHCAS